MSNLLRLLVLLAVLSPPYVLLLLVCGVSLPLSLTLVLIALLSLAFLQAETATTRTLRGANAKALDSEKFAQIHRDAQDLALKLKVGVPELLITESPEINATVLDQQGRKVRILLSRGALERLTAQEMRALIAHELAHVALNDLRFMVFAQALIKTAAFPVTNLTNALRLRPRQDPLLIELLLNLAGFLMGFFFLRRAEYRADRLAHLHSATGALESALMKVYGPQGLTLPASALSSHPSLSERLKAIA